MSDYDLSKLNSAFAELRGVAAGHVNPPGLAAARATVTRRRRTRLAVLSAITVALLVVPLAVFAAGRNGTDPAPFDSPTPAVSESPKASPSASAPAQAPPSGAPTGPSATLMAYTPIWVFSGNSGIRVDLPRSIPFTIPIGVDVFSRNSTRVGPATNVKLTIDLSGIWSNVEVAGVTGPCAVNGSLVECDYGTLNQGYHDDSLTLRGRPGATTDVDGTVRLWVTGTETSWMNQELTGIVKVTQQANMADMVWNQSTTSTNVGIGDTVTLTATARNNGPSAQSRIEYTNPQGLELIGTEGCPVNGEGRCQVDNIAVGATSTVRLTYRVNDCAAHGNLISAGTISYVHDPISFQRYWNLPTLRVAGC